MSVQPTPRSITAAEERLGEVPPETVDAVGHVARACAPTARVTKKRASKHLPTRNAR